MCLNHVSSLVGVAAFAPAFSTAFHPHPPPPPDHQLQAAPDAEHVGCERAHVGRAAAVSIQHLPPRQHHARGPARPLPVRLVPGAVGQLAQLRGAAASTPALAGHASAVRWLLAPQADDGSPADDTEAVRVPEKGSFGVHSPG